MSAPRGRVHTEYTAPVGAPTPDLGLTAHLAGDDTFMDTMLLEAEPTGLTHRVAVEIRWDRPKAAKSPKMCEYEADQECICAEGEDCWLV